MNLDFDSHKNECFDYSGGRFLEAIWSNSNIDLIQKMILQFFAHEHNYGGNTKIIDTPIETIFTSVGISKQNAITNLKILEDLGYLSNKIHLRKRFYRITEKLFSEYEIFLISKGLKKSKASQMLFNYRLSLNTIWKLDLKSSPKALLLWLGSNSACINRNNFTEHEYLSYSHQEICKELNIGEDFLRKLIKDLESKGFLKFNKKNTNTNEYSLTKKTVLEKNKNVLEITPSYLTDDAENRTEFLKEYKTKAQSYFKNYSENVSCLFEEETKLRKKKNSIIVNKDLFRDLKRMSLIYNMSISKIVENILESYISANGI